MYVINPDCVVIVTQPTKKLEDGEGEVKAGERADGLIFRNPSADPVHGGDLVRTGLTGSNFFMFFQTALSHLRRLF